MIQYILDCVPYWQVDAVFPVEFPAGKVIIKQGDEGENFYIVQEGEGEVHVAPKGSTTGQLPKKVMDLRQAFQ